MAMVWLVVRGGDVVAACGAVRASAGFATVVMLIFGGWVPQDLCSSHVRCLKSSAAARWAGAQATNRGVGVREPGCSGRLASRNGMCAELVSVSW